MTVTIIMYLILLLPLPCHVTMYPNPSGVCSFSRLRRLRLNFPWIRFLRFRGLFHHHQRDRRLHLSLSHGFRRWRWFHLHPILWNLWDTDTDLYCTSRVFTGTSLSQSSQNHQWHLNYWRRTGETRHCKTRTSHRVNKVAGMERTGRSGPIHRIGIGRGIRGMTRTNGVRTRNTRREKKVIPPVKRSLIVVTRCQFSDQENEKEALCCRRSHLHHPEGDGAAKHPGSGSIPMPMPSRWRSESYTSRKRRARNGFNVADQYRSWYRIFWPGLWPCLHPFWS